MNKLPVLSWRGVTNIPLKPITIFVCPPEPKIPITTELTEALTALKAVAPGEPPVLLKIIVDVLSYVHTPKQQIATSALCVKHAMEGRNYAIITLCDHFIRGIMTAVAKAPIGSAEESWLMENVVIVMVSDDNLTPYSLDSYGKFIGLSVGDPLSDFIDGGAESDGERFFAGLHKYQKSVVDPD